MIEKMDMKSMDITEENVKKIQALFPSAVTEVIDGYTKDEKGQDKPVYKLKIDFDVLKQELSENLIEDKQERYQMTWPDKSKAKVLASSRITSTLRPDKEKSVDFDNTQNLYIEGDNLDVLKLLRETYLGKVKMIYIDPPYNTGNDFVYNDDFSQSSEEYMETSGQYDEEGNRLVKNLESNGRFHTDWLNMIYPRLKVAKDLLSDDGVIFISIDDNEQTNLEKICDEIFGYKNKIATLAIENNPKGRKNGKYLSINHESCVVYAKNYEAGNGFFNVVPKENLLQDEKGFYSQGQRVLVGKSSNKIATNEGSDKYYFVYYKRGLPIEIRKQIDSGLIGYKLYVSQNEQGALLENTYTAEKLVSLYDQGDLIFNENTIYEKDRNTYKQQKTLICANPYYDLKTESENFVDANFDLRLFLGFGDDGARCYAAQCGRRRKP